MIYNVTSRHQPLLKVYLGCNYRGKGVKGLNIRSKMERDDINSVKDWKDEEITRAVVYMRKRTDCW